MYLLLNAWMGQAERILINQVFWSKIFYKCHYIDMVQGYDKEANYQLSEIIEILCFDDH